MKISQLIAQHVEEVVDGNWTDIFLKDVLKDISYKEAIGVPTGITNSIAMLVHHILYYNEIVEQRLKNLNPAFNNANGFNVDINNEEDWQQLKQKCINSFKELANTVRQFPDEKLEEINPRGNSTFYKMLHGVVEHAHYHLGQIVLLKKIIKYNHAVS
ncbi:MAG: DinB family protein [Chitinophagaceae bacterium]